MYTRLTSYGCTFWYLQVESSLAFYDKVVDIWYKFLASVRSDPNLAENVGKAQLSEGMDMLTRVLNTRVNLLGETHIATVSELLFMGIGIFYLRHKGGPQVYPRVRIGFQKKIKRNRLIPRTFFMPEKFTWYVSFGKDSRCLHS